MENENCKTCKRGAWGLAAVVGVLIFLALLLLGGAAFFKSLIWAVIAFVILGFVFSWLLCRNRDCSKTNTHLVDQDTISAASDTVSTTPAASAAPAPEVSEPPAQAEAPAAPVAAAEIKPSTPLSGEEDLANRTLDWKYTAPAAEAPKAAKPTAKAAPAAEATPDYDGDGVCEGENEGTRPEALSAAREGGADDLKRIKGIGPKIEKLCNELGFYHFDQIAGWSAAEVAWVNANLAGFKGRVSRDNWVEQAKLLASGEETEFSKRVDKGGVY